METPVDYFYTQTPARIHDLMIAFAPPHAGVTREKALSLDPLTLEVWKDELAWTW